MTKFEITIDDTGKAKATINLDGDIAAVGRAIVKLANNHEELALTLNTGMMAVNKQNTIPGNNDLIRFFCIKTNK